MSITTHAAILILRGLKILLFVLTSAAGFFFFKINNLGFYYCLGILFALSLFWLFVFRKKLLDERTQSILQFVLDVTLENVLIHFSGGVQSPFIFLLIFDVFLGAYILSKRWMQVLWLYIAFSYAGFTFLAYLGHLPAFLTTQNEFIVSADVYIYYVVLMRVFIFFMIGYLASQFSARIQSQEATIAQMRNLTEKILFQLGSGLITVDDTDRVIYSNKSASDLLGVENIDMFGRRWQKLFFPDGEPLDTDFQEKADSMHGFPVEIINGRHEVLPLSVSISKLIDDSNRKLGQTIFFRDLTHEKEIERLKNEQKKIKTLEELSRTLAHEIKNPLASICGSLEVLNESHMYEDFQSKRLTQVILKESERLSRILTDFLLFSGEMNLRKQVVNLSNILDDIFLILEHNNQIPDNVLITRQVSESEDLMADVDKDAFTQMLVNLVLNGAQAIQGSGEVKVSLSAEKNSGGSVINLAVSDTGEGIPDSVREDIFKPFFTMRPKGMGLGLNVCSKIIHQHGWNFNLESTPDVGTTFKISIPHVLPGGVNPVL